MTQSLTLASAHTDAQSLAQCYHDPAWMLSDAKCYQDASDIDPDTLAYVFCPAFDLASIDGWIAGKWSHLAAQYQERCLHAEEPVPNEFENFTDAIRTGTIDPLTIMQDTDGTFYIWDGNHRAGTAYTIGVSTIPACVGYQRIAEVID